MGPSWFPGYPTDLRLPSQIFHFLWGCPVGTERLTQSTLVTMLNTAHPGNPGDANPPADYLGWLEADGLLSP